MDRELCKSTLKVWKIKNIKQNGGPWKLVFSVPEPNDSILKTSMLKNLLAF